MTYSTYCTYVFNCFGSNYFSGFKTKEGANLVPSRVHLATLSTKQKLYVASSTSSSSSSSHVDHYRYHHQPSAGHASWSLRLFACRAFSCSFGLDWGRCHQVLPEFLLPPPIVLRINRTTRPILPMCRQCSI